MLLLALTRPFAVEFLNKDRIRTNAESLLGLTGVVIEDIDNLRAQGLVSVEGQEWTARSVSEEVILKDTHVEIVKISGVKLLVKVKPQFAEK